MADTSDARRCDEFRDQAKKDAENLVKDVFPKKVIQLNELLDSKKFGLSRISDFTVDLNIPVPEPLTDNGAQEPHTKKRKVEEDVNHFSIPGTKVYSLPHGTVSSNKCIVELVDVVKPYIRDLIDHANKIKMWITYLIPRIEDGNNFGVSVQEDTMAEARQVESEAATYLDQISRYFITRGKILSKVAKYPHVEDYRRTVQELDEKEFISLRLVVCELRNHYCSLHDVIIKNLDKIKKPRTTNTDNMY